MLYSWNNVQNNFIGTNMSITDNKREKENGHSVLIWCLILKSFINTFKGALSRYYSEIEEIGVWKAWFHKWQFIFIIFWVLHSKIFFCAYLRFTLVSPSCTRPPSLVALNLLPWIKKVVIIIIITIKIKPIFSKMMASCAVKMLESFNHPIGSHLTFENRTVQLILRSFSCHALQWGLTMLCMWNVETVWLISLTADRLDLDLYLGSVSIAMDVCTSRESACSRTQWREDRAALPSRPVSDLPTLSDPAKKDLKPDLVPDRSCWERP